MRETGPVSHLASVEVLEAQQRTPPQAPPARREPSARLLSLDAFRGITIAGMVLVNNPGSWTDIYSPLRHAEWHGWTPTDLIFPFFVFIVGMAITLALGPRVEGGAAGLHGTVLRRTRLIFLVGLVLNGFPYFHLSTLRIPGVLQRIALCYGIAALIFLHTRWRAQAAIGSALLLVYWALMKLVPVPQFGAGDLSMAGNLAAYLDRTLLSGHIYRPLYDPEGLLSTVPSIATALAGILAGHWLRSRREPLEKVTGFFAAGAAAVVVGWSWNLAFPINKPLWTSSYVLFTAGLALQLFAVCYWLIDVKGYRRWATPFLVFGANALAAYFLSSIGARLMGLLNVKTWMMAHVFNHVASPVNASLLFALSYVLLWLGVMAVLYRRGIFIRL